MKLKIGILGCRGIPNHYGGFEQCAEQLSIRLVDRGHEVYVYNSNLHPYKYNYWQGVNIIHCKDWEDKLGAAGQFVYDWNCITDCRKRNFDIVLQLGYTSSSIWYWRWPKNSIHLVNMDGLEWKRTQYSKPVQRFIRHAEALAARHANLLIADSIGIQVHLLDSYNKTSTFIPYGADIFNEPNVYTLDRFSLEPNAYYLAVARLEPENNLEMILRGYLQSHMDQPLAIVGTVNQFGKELKRKFPSEHIRFLGPVYQKNLLNNLRYYSKLHFHGHSVGGTNPSLLEAMSCQANIVAHDNIFNKGILGCDADYFITHHDITQLIHEHVSSTINEQRKQENLRKVREVYNWDNIANAYEKLMLRAIGLKENEVLPSPARQIA